MEKPRPIWQDLPRHLKTNIAENLGDKSRQSLGQCSKMDREIIQGIPFLMKSMVIGSQLIESVEMANRIFRTYQYESVKMGELLETVINDVINIVKHPKSIIDSIVYNLESFQGIFYPNLVQGLKAQNLRIRAKKVRFCVTHQLFQSWNFNANHLELLELLDPNVLEMIELSIMDDEFFQKLVKTEQWKKSTRVSINVGRCENVRIEDFLHFDQMNFCGFKELNEKDKTLIVESFQKRDPPVNSFFFITSSGYLFSLPFMETLTKKEYEMPTPGNKLLVEMNDGMIQGRVVNETENSSIYKLLRQLHS